MCRPHPKNDGRSWHLPSVVPYPWGIDGATLKIDDDSQGGLSVLLRVRHAVLDATEVPDGFVLEAASDEPSAGSKRPLEDAPAEGDAKRQAGAAEDGVEVLE